MRTYLLIGVVMLFASCSQKKWHDRAVYVCSGEHAEKYHGSPRCKGLENCHGDTKYLSEKDAKDYGFKPCDIDGKVDISSDRGFVELVLYQFDYLYATLICATCFGIGFVIDRSNKKDNRAVSFISKVFMAIGFITVILILTKIGYIKSLI